MPVPVADGGAVDLRRFLPFEEEALSASGVRGPDGFVRRGTGVVDSLCIVKDWVPGRLPLPNRDEAEGRLASSSEFNSPGLVLLLRFLGRPEPSFSSSSGVRGLCDMVLSRTGESNELLRPDGDGGDHEVGLGARVGAALTLFSRHPITNICSAEMASVVSFSDWGTKLLVG